MPNIASILKDEIARVARKVLRSEVEGLRKSVATHRTEIAALKKRAHTLELELRKLSKSAVKTKPVIEEPAKESIRFSAKGLASHRKRLGLSANDCGLLIGASGQSIYNWEAGTARPRAAHLSAIAALKGMGKKEAVARLEAMRGAG